MGGSSWVGTVEKCLVSTIGKRAVLSNDNNGGAPESKKLRTEETHGEWCVYSLSLKSDASTYPFKLIKIGLTLSIYPFPLYIDEE